MTPEDAARLLQSLGVTAMGANCGRKVEETADAVCAMRSVAPEVPMIIKPNAGLPRMVDGRPVYDMSPETLVAYARQWIAEGIKVIGGCDGTTPDHIRAIALTVQGAYEEERAAYGQTGCGQDHPS